MTLDFFLNQRLSAQQLSLGKGFTASYGIASSDLSGTNVIATSTIVDLAGGMLFRQKSDDTLTDLSINYA